MYTNKKQNGFTLIEIIASIAILGVVVVAVLPIFPQILSWTNNVDDELIASNLLDQITYELTQSYANETAQETPSCSDNVSNAMQQAYTYQDDAYSAEMEMSQTEAEKQYGLYRIHINVYAAGQNKAVSDTYVYLSCERDGHEAI
ncbi:type II secretion system protein [Lentibacillus sp. N15]|uniref:type II secretion system protein n=1 Tax=Lentibacillus songyuanensis TaxID=3136161 RepID=UPI0031BA7B00